jgi:hypothetical protein
VKSKLRWTKARKAQLAQLAAATFADNLISKREARWLYHQYLATEREGWWLATGLGLRMLVKQKVLKP